MFGLKLIKESEYSELQRAIIENEKTSRLLTDKNSELLDEITELKDVLLKKDVEIGELNNLIVGLNSEISQLTAVKASSKTARRRKVTKKTTNDNN